VPVVIPMFWHDFQAGCLVRAIYERRQKVRSEEFTREEAAEEVRKKVLHCQLILSGRMVLPPKSAMKSRVLIVCALLMGVFVFPNSPSHAAAPVSLAGQWRFQLDREDAGIMEEWYQRRLQQNIRLPGALQAQGFGDDVSVATKWTGQIVDRSYFNDPRYAKYRQPGNIKVPFWLQPDKYYVGAAWYQRDIEIPSDWQNQRVVLALERPHWQTLVWLDGRIIGSNDSLSTPHEYDLGLGISPGQHRLTIRVDNRLIVDVGINSHSVSDHTQGNWNGIAGRIELSASNPVWIDDLQIYPHLANRSVTVKGKLANLTGQSGQAGLRLVAEPIGGESTTPLAAKELQVTWTASGGEFETEYPLGDGAKWWDEFTPSLYRLTAILDHGKDERAVSFGLREISTQGTQFLVNGRKSFFRGTLECAIFPLTGHPATDMESWKRIIRIAKAHGLNLIRFHSWCPPEAAFAAADELGFYYQVEVASWANQSSLLGVGLPVDAWLCREAGRILKAYGNHPSFVLMPYGNEPAGKDREFLTRWVLHFRGKDGRRLYTSGSGWPQIPENQFHVTPDPRIQGWGQGLKSRINAHPPETRTDYRDYIRQRNVPVISHEIGQWCVYPNFDEIPKYLGYLKAKNFEIFRDSLAEHHMIQQAHDFLLASGKLQTLCYKEDIESALRTPGMGGFELLDLHDFPGQGTALVGVLDPFWDSKGYVTAAEYSRFCNSTVPLARLNQRVFTTDEKLEADLEVAHFGPAPLENISTACKLVDDEGKVLASGTLPARDIPVDNGIALGHVSIDLSRMPAPLRSKLVVGLSGTKFENDWDVWVYPSKVNVQPPPGVSVVSDLDDAALAKLNAGGKILFLVPPDRVKGDKLGKVELGFSSIFWNTAWTNRQPPHTLGILCDPRLPALSKFPTDNHSNWQWWYLVTRAGAMILDGLPSDWQPAIQVIDDWVTNRKLGLLFEAKVGGGSLMVCSIDLKKEMDRNPVARQLLHSILAYMGSGQFNPRLELAPEQVRGLIK